MPNFIVMQPDDFPFYDEWSPPANNPKEPPNPFPYAYAMPNIEYLRTTGLQMMQAYATSASCAPSRFSTLTGKYPSRSGYNRMVNNNEFVSSVMVTNSKLEDIQGQTKDCTEENMAAVFKANGYKTGFAGKWHLTGQRGIWDYEVATTMVKECGFDSVDGLYVDNFADFSDGTFSHNMEWVTKAGVDFIKKNAENPFLLYFNPTVPHPSEGVYASLTEYTCKDTPAGRLNEEPIVIGMTADYGDCRTYRESVIERSGFSQENHDLGAILVDDSVGALLLALRETNQLENTLFLFQIDHGIEAKFTLYENGIRIPQFISYPKEFGIDGMQYYGLVQNIDIVPTLFDFANIKSYYQMDGESWRNKVNRPTSENQRCLAFEGLQDRAIVCGCEKYLYLDTSGRTARFGRDQGLAHAERNLFNICEPGTNEYVTYGGRNPEIDDVASYRRKKFFRMRDIMACFLDKTSPIYTPDFSVRDCYNSGENIFGTLPDSNTIGLTLTTFPSGALLSSSSYPSSSYVTLYPSTNPSNASTERCIDVSSFTILEGDQSGNVESCDWVLRANPDHRCNLYGHLCRSTCGLCRPLNSGTNNVIVRKSGNHEIPLFGVYIISVGLFAIMGTALLYFFKCSVRKRNAARLENCP